MRLRQREQPRLVLFQINGSQPADSGFRDAVLSQKGGQSSFELSMLSSPTAAHAQRNDSGHQVKRRVEGLFRRRKEDDDPRALIVSCTRTGAVPAEGYDLQVTILAEAIQADGKTSNGTKAVVDAWGVDPSTLS